LDQQELKNILELHRKWVMGEENGKRADLRSANLSYANLSSADLRSANLSSADLSYADLSSADLRYANLSSADLRSANLSYANLRSANLSYADLSYANLRSADLRSADLRSANLSYANLRYANLRSADLRSADLRSANLSYANLRSAKNEEIIADFCSVLDIAKAEAIGLYRALLDGKIDGSHYEGECACLVGTVANCRKENYTALTIDLKPKSDRLSERWFLAIQKGDIPENNPVSQLTKEWIEAWAIKNEIKLPKLTKVWVE
jgi:hypothetical protein